MSKFWTLERLEEAQILRKKLGTSPATAEALSKRWKVPISPGALRRALCNLPEREVPDVPPLKGVPPRDGEVAWQNYRPLSGYEPPQQVPATVQRSDTLRGVIIPDTHVPMQDRVAFSVALGILREWKPHFGVILGDFMDMESLSSHGKSRPDVVRLAQEYYAGNLALDALQNSAPDADWTYIEGNHENRATRFTNEMGELDGLLTVPEQLYIQARSDGYRRHKTELRGMRWIGLEDQPFLTPHSAYYHGHHSTAKHHAAWHADVYCPSRTGGRPLFYGHMHSFQEFSSASGNYAACSGFLGDEKALRYTLGRPTAWVHGLVLQEVTKDGFMTHQMVRIVNGRAIVGGKVILSCAE